jgi:hypothetical protein
VDNRSVTAQNLRLNAIVSTINESGAGEESAPALPQDGVGDSVSVAISLHLSFFPIRLPGYNNVSFAPQSSSK